MLATELYAISQGTACNGPDRCYWCGSQTLRVWPHDGPPRMAGYKTITTARCPGNSYICIGCWLWGRKRITVNYLTGRIQDSQAPANHSWWITEEGAWTLGAIDYPELIERLLKPPRKCCLILRGEGPNKIHLAPCNDLLEVKADTPIQFELNSVTLAYTVYELDLLVSGKEVKTGKEPGTQLLAKLLGRRKLPNGIKELIGSQPVAQVAKGRGRPLSPEYDPPGRKVVTASGR